jgi:hypothetical protein
MELENKDREIEITTLHRRMFAHFLGTLWIDVSFS